jgi:hypothetical protein
MNMRANYISRNSTDNGNKVLATDGRLVIVMNPPASKIPWHFQENIFMLIEMMCGRTWNFVNM